MMMMMMIKAVTKVMLIQHQSLSSFNANTKANILAMIQTIFISLLKTEY